MASERLLTNPVAGTSLISAAFFMRDRQHKSVGGLLDPKAITVACQLAEIAHGATSLERATQALPATGRRAHRVHFLVVGSVR
jgi:hypothetical protein